MPASRTYRVLRIVVAVLVLGFAAVVAVGNWFSHHYKGLIQERLPALSAKATDSLYHITIEDLRINIFTRAITIAGVRMSVDTGVLLRRRAQGRSPGRIYDITIPEIEIRGLKWSGLETERELGCRKIRLLEPKIIIRLSADSVTDTARRPPPQLKRLFARQISIVDPEFQVFAGDSAGTQAFRSKGGQITATDWNYSPGAPVDTTRLFFTRQVEVLLEQVQLGLPRTLYTLSLDSFQFASGTSMVRLGGVQIKSSVNRDEFYRRAGMQREIYTLRCPEVLLKGLAWGALLENGAIVAPEMSVTGAELDVFFSRMPPPNTVNKMGHYPNQLLQRLSTPLVLPAISLHNCSVRYTEFNSKTMRPGSISFTQVEGKVTGVSNVPGDIARNPHCLISLNGKFMDRSDISTTFDFVLSSREGAFGISAVMRDLDGAMLGEPAQALALADIKSLQLDSLVFRIDGDEDSSNGIFRIAYSKLKIKLLKLDTGTMSMRNRPFVSFLANNLLLYSDNPMDEDSLRIAYTHVARDPLKPFFNLIWKNLFNGFVQTAIRSEGLTDLVKRQRANKGKPKRHFFKGLFPKRKKKDGSR